MDGLDLLGAADAFANQYVTFRVKSIDRDQLQYKLGGSKGSIASSALSIAETSPKAMLDLVTPILKNKAKDYGVDAEIVVSNVPPSKGGRALSEFWPGLIAGGIIGGASLLIYKAVTKLVER